MNYIKKISFIVSLVFFFLSGCRQQAAEEKITIEWEDNKAVRIVIPSSRIGDVGKEDVEKRLLVYLSNGNGPAILGEYYVSADASGIVFRPLIPFTRGLKYKIMFDKKMVDEIDIPAASKDDAPTVIAFYPTRDTVPENLLKVYIQFSKPMQEGESLRHIVLVRNDKDTVQSVFLDLEPELWNNDRTMLTLWLDPGRIKRDLQPNLKLGPPLRKGERYHLLIKQDWLDETGNALAKTFQKDFVVGMRDSLSPDPSRWSFVYPKAGSNDALKVDLHESLDYSLLNAALHVEDQNDNDIAGAIAIGKSETSLFFQPTEPWQPGKYNLVIESRLEDNSGNNLNRLFDKDLAKPSKESSKSFYKLPFTIK